MACLDPLRGTNSGFHLAEEVYWHNPAKLPSPIEWVNKRKLRMKDLLVNTVWWFGKTGMAESRRHQGAGTLQRADENAAEGSGGLLQTQS